MLSSLLPSEKLRTLLEKTRLQSWTVSHATQHAASLSELRQLLNGVRPQNSSRTHKKADGRYWGIQVVSQPNQHIGVDLEYLSDEFLRRDHPTALELLDLEKDSTPQDLLVEWSSREAAFKAIQQSGRPVELKELKRANKNSLSVVNGPGALTCQVETICDGRWVLSIAKLYTSMDRELEGA